MKKTIFIAISICLSLLLNAQVSKTVTITAGSLKTALTALELKTITNLTLSGALNASDFLTMRDMMPVLAVLDLSGVTITDNAIPDNAFFNFSTYSGKVSLKTIVFPSTITSIGSSAFNGCSGLSGNLNIPNSLKSIEDYAFSDCSGLTGNLIIPNSVTKIGMAAFQSCSGFTGKLMIPASISSISDYAFVNCTGFTGDLEIPQSVQSIGKNAFFGLNNLTGRLIIPNSVNSIGEAAFDNCSFTGNVTLPNSITRIEGYTFYNCQRITSITIPNSVTSIGRAAFNYCIGINGSLNIPISIDSIAAYAFSSCRGITGELNIPNSTTYIGDYAFQDCGITSCTLGKNVRNFGAGAFGANSNLNAINVVDDNEYLCSVDGVLFNKEKTELIAFVNKEFIEYTVPDGVISIAGSAFRSCSNLINITIPNSVIKIGGEAFLGTQWFDNQPNGLLFINSVAYKYKGLIPADTKIFLPEGTKSISGSAFYESMNASYGLTFINIPNTVVDIGDYAFRNCQGLTSINIPKSVTSIGYESFAYSGLDSITFLNGIKSIGSYAFFVCYSLASVTIPGSVDFIENKAFSSCENLKEFHIRRKIPLKINSNVFEYMKIYNCNLFVPYGSLELYKSADVWKDFKNIIEEDTINVNHTPVANAGSDQSVNEGIIVSLNGSNSYDPDGNPLTFKWTAPVGITLSSNSTSKPTFIAPEVTKDTTYTFALVVNDGIVDSPPSTLKVTVQNVIKVGNSEISAPIYKVYPNPSTGVVNIEFTQNNDKKTEIIVCNMIGAVIFRKDISNVAKFQFYLSNQINGIYMIKIISGNQRYISKIVMGKE